MLRREDASFARDTSASSVAAGLCYAARMPPHGRLPPPPEDPVRSPAAAVRGEELVTLPGDPPLEARVRVPSGAERAVVLCHPHPLYGGSMHSPVILSLARYLAEKGEATVATLRFNFRGVGASGGRYDDGQGELGDARRAISFLRERASGAALSVCGHSFGSWVGLRAAGMESAVERVGLVAPSTRFFDFGAEALPRFLGKLMIFIGDDDEFSTEGEARALAEKIGAGIHVFPGFDHHFMKSRRQMAEVVAPFVAPEIGS